MNQQALLIKGAQASCEMRMLSRFRAVRRKVRHGGGSRIGRVSGVSGHLQRYVNPLHLHALKNS